MDPFVAQGIQKMAPGSFGGHSSIITPLHLTPQTVRRGRVGTPPVPTCAVEFSPVTTTRGISTGAMTSAPIVDGLYIYQSKVVSGVSVIQRWDWDTFNNETTAYTPTQRLGGTVVPGGLGVRSVTADASYIYWTEFEQTNIPAYEQRVMKADHSFSTVTVLVADTTTGGFVSPFTYGQLVRSPTTNDLALAYTQVVSGTTHYLFDTIDSSSAARTNFRDTTSFLTFVTATAWMTYTPDGALWGQDSGSQNYWRYASGTFTSLGDPFAGTDQGLYLVPTPQNTILTGRFTSGGSYVDQYELDSSGGVTLASCDYQTIFAHLTRFVGWSPDVSTIGFGGIISGGSSGTPADHHFYRWG